MDLIKNFLDAEGKGLIDRLCNRTELEGDKLSTLVENLVAELNVGIQGKLENGPLGFMELLEGVDMSLLNKLVGEGESLEQNEAQSLGSSLLGNISGGEQGVKDLVAKLNSATGIDLEKIELLLPELTASFMSFFSKSAGGAGELLSTFGGANSVMDSLSSALDSDGDGDVGDDIMEAAKKLF